MTGVCRQLSAAPGKKSPGFYQIVAISDEYDRAPASRFTRAAGARVRIQRGGGTMSAGAQLSVTDQRRSTRHPVDLPLIGEHRRIGDIMLNLINVSTTGFMVRGPLDLDRGERLTIRLPHIGRIEAFLVWSDHDRSGFQFERIVRIDDFAKMIKSLQPNPRLRSPH
jgi:hypothetical protein